MSSVCSNRIVATTLSIKVWYRKSGLQTHFTLQNSSFCRRNPLLLHFVSHIGLNFLSDNFYLLLHPLPSCNYIHYISKICLNGTLALLASTNYQFVSRLIPIYLRSHSQGISTELTVSAGGKEVISAGATAKILANFDKLCGVSVYAIDAVLLPCPLL